MNINLENVKKPKYQTFARIIVDTVRNDAEMICSKLLELDNVNRYKYESMKNVTTTELISNVDLLTLYAIAKELDVPVMLPSRMIRGSHVLVDYKWGTVVLLSNMTEN